MRHSESQAEIGPALVNALALLNNPAKTATNPFFKSLYAPLPATLDGVRPVLAEHGLALMQSAESVDGRPAIVTRLVHTSGEWIESSPFALKPQKDDPQGFGGAITYARRYSLEAFLGISGDTDDDGHYASQPKRGASRKANAGPAKARDSAPSPAPESGQAPAPGPAPHAAPDAATAPGYPAGWGPDTVLPASSKHAGQVVRDPEIPDSYFTRLMDKGRGKWKQLGIAELARREKEAAKGGELRNEDIPFGEQTRCPGCGSEHFTISEDNSERTCRDCGIVFAATGKVLSQPGGEPEKPEPEAARPRCPRCQLKLVPENDGLTCPNCERMFDAAGKPLGQMT